jgi:hypothetical protein
MVGVGVGCQGFGSRRGIEVKSGGGRAGYLYRLKVKVKLLSLSLSFRVSSMSVSRSELLGETK